MNKQEFQQKIKNMEPPKNFTFISAHDAYEKGFEKAKGTALFNSYFLDEPEKPIVPQFVAEWIEDNREALEEYVYSNVQIVLPKIQDDNPMYNWLNGKGIGIIVDCIRNGYEIEKEKLYTVKFANEDFGKMYIGFLKRVNKLGVSSLPLNNDEVKSWFTEDELKRFKFWNNSAFEVVEVKK